MAAPAMGSTSSLVPCVMKTGISEREASAAMRASHSGVATGAPLSWKTPPSLAPPASGWCSARSSAVMAPWLNPPMATLLYDTPPKSAIAAWTKLPMSSRAAGNPSGVSCTSDTSASSPMNLLMIQRCTSISHHAGTPTDPMRACGNANTTLCAAKPPALTWNMRGRSAKSSAVAPKPCMSTTRRSGCSAPALPGSHAPVPARMVSKPPTVSRFWKKAPPPGLGGAWVWPGGGAWVWPSVGLAEYRSLASSARRMRSDFSTQPLSGRPAAWM
mmetsp:Transcript_24420/g.76578  ORF Transcript_24420/g.76578 Transcript_24420/m.76578 type:complete len:272 (+) Transcript_24420:311-1126(+)